MSATSILTADQITYAKELAVREGKPAREVIRRFARYEARKASLAYRELSLVVDLFAVAAHLARAWLDEHGLGCRCDHCRNDDPGDLRDIAADLDRLEGAAGVAVNNVEGFIPASDRFMADHDWREGVASRVLRALAGDASAIERLRVGEPAELTAVTTPAR